MATLTFDSYDFIQRLKDAGLPEPQAKAIADGLRNIDLDHVATKDDLNNLRVELKNDLSSFKVDLFKWLVPMLFAQTAAIVGLLKLVQ